MEVSQKLENKYYGREPRQLSSYESGLLYLYHPENFDQDRKIFVKKLYQNGQIVEVNKKIPSDEVLASIRMNYLDEIEAGKLNKFVVRTIVDREIDYYKNLRKRFKNADDGGRLTWQILTQEEILLRLAEVAALGPEEKYQLSQKFPSLKAKFTAVPGTKPLKTPLVIEPAVEEPKIIIKEPLSSPPTTIPEEEQIATMVISIQKPKIVPEPKTPAPKTEEFESWQKVPTAMELSAAQAQEWAKIGQKLRLPHFDLQPSLERVWNNRRVRNAILAGLVLANSTFNFKENEPTVFSLLAEGAQGIPPAVQSLSQEAQQVFLQMQKDLVQLQKNIPQVTATLEKIKAAVTPVPESKPVEAVPIREKVPEPPAVPAPPPVAVKTEAELTIEFRSAESPVPPPGYVHPETPPEKGYDKYIRPGWQSRTRSPYIKGLDYGVFSWAGVGDVQNPEDVDRIPLDANAKNFRMTMMSEGDIPRVAAVVEKAHGRGMKVAVNFSTPELAADKIKFRETIRRILMEAWPDYLQYENEMGWLDEKGKPNQYYVGSHESIWKDYPGYVKIMQDEIRERERVTGNKTKLVIGSLGWDFWANNSKLDKFVQGLVAAGVDFNSAYVDIHVFDHLDGDWDSQESIARYLKILELNGIKNPKTLSLEMYIGADQTPQYVARGFDVYHQRYGFDLVIAYPVTGDWRK